MKDTYTTNLSLPKMDFGILVFRIGISAIMLLHGVPKVGMLFGGDEIQFADPIGIGMVASLALATFAEFICSILIILGLGTRLAALVLIINMGVAVFIQHYSMSFLDNGKQLPLLFLLGYILLYYTGSGRFSLDKLFLTKKKRESEA